MSTVTDTAPAGVEASGLDTLGPPAGPPVSIDQPGPRPDVPRPTRTRTFDDWMSLGGSALGSLALVWVVYSHVLPFSGKLGFTICWYVSFLVLYAVVVSATNPRSVVTDRLATAWVWAGALVVGSALVTTIGYTFYKGWDAYTHVNFFTQDMSGVSGSAPFTEGGILHAIIGTFIQVGIAIAIAVPLGIGTAVYMAEVGSGTFARVVRTVVEAMTGLPEILAGLFVYVSLIVALGFERSGFAAAVAMCVTMVPIIARASEVALRIVPGGLREAGAALGASQWQTVRRVVLPSARAGLATAVILGIARGIGETAVVLITSGASTYINTNPFKDPMNSLPLYVFVMVKSGIPEAETRAFGAAAVLLTIVVILFVITRILARDKKVAR